MTYHDGDVIQLAVLLHRQLHKARPLLLRGLGALPEVDHVLEVRALYGGVQHEEAARAREHAHVVPDRQLTLTKHPHLG